MRTFSKPLLKTTSLLTIPRYCMSVHVLSATENISIFVASLKNGDRERKLRTVNGILKFFPSFVVPQKIRLKIFRHASTSNWFVFPC